MYFPKGLSLFRLLVYLFFVGYYSASHSRAVAEMHVVDGKDLGESWLSYP